MKRLFLASTIAASWISFSIPNALAAGPGVVPRGTCAGLMGLPLPNTQILIVPHAVTLLLRGQSSEAKSEERRSPSERLAPSAFSLKRICDRALEDLR